MFSCILKPRRMTGNHFLNDILCCTAAAVRTATPICSCDFDSMNVAGAVFTFGCYLVSKHEMAAEKDYDYGSFSYYSLQVTSN